MQFFTPLASSVSWYVLSPSATCLSCLSGVHEHVRCVATSHIGPQLYAHVLSVGFNALWLVGITSCCGGGMVDACMMGADAAPEGSPEKAAALAMVEGLTWVLGTFAARCHRLTKSRNAFNPTL